MVLAAFFLALALILPFISGQVQQLGNALCPMHFPVLLCGFFCGPWYGLAVGFVAPLLRFVMFGMPPVMPVGVAMCFELAAYGVVSGLLYRVLPRKKIFIYVSLIAAMITGRILWGAVRTLLYGLGQSEFGWTAFVAGAFTTAIPGIIIQLILIPVLVIVLTRAFPQLND